MNTKLYFLLIALALFVGINPAVAQGTTSFTYQGQLHDGGTNANGVYTMTFALYDDSSTSNQIGGTITTTPTLANGLFTVNLDFGGGAFDGSARWLDITISEGGTTQELSPRVQVLPAPYALFANIANNLSGALAGDQLAGVYSNAVTLNNPGNSLSGNGGGVTNVDAVLLGGFSSTNFATLIGLYSSNYVQLTFDPDTGGNDLIASKIRFASNVSILGNTILSSNFNAKGDSYFSTNAYFNGEAIFETKDSFNGEAIFGTNAYFNGEAIFQTNAIFNGEAIFQTNAFFTGGDTTFETNVFFQGQANFNSPPLFTTNAFFQANVYLGAPNNEWQISQMGASFGTIAISNCLSFLNDGTMQMAIAPPGVTVDNQPAGLALFGSLAVLNGGVEISSGNISQTKGNLRVHNGNFNLDNGNVFIGGSVIVTNNLNCGPLAVAGNETVTGNVSVIGAVYANNLVYSMLVPVNVGPAKAPISSVNGQDILSKVASLPISIWGSTRDAKTQHVGPMAHDFQAAFGLGKDDNTISLVDESGVALAAIQALNEKLKEKDAQIAILNKRLGDLEQIVNTFTQK